MFCSPPLLGMCHHRASGLELEKVGAHRAALSCATGSPEAEKRLRLR